MVVKSKKKKIKNIKAPRSTKFRKWHKFYVKQYNYSKWGTQLQYGQFGLKILQPARVYWTQIESARQKISRFLKKKNKLWIRVFPDTPVTAKPKEVRMGKGKGAVSHYVIRAEAGRVLFEVKNVDRLKAQMMFLNAKKKLPVPTVFLEKRPV